MIGCEIIACTYYTGYQCTYPENQCVLCDEPGYGINDLLREICDLRANLKTAEVEIEKLQEKQMTHSYVFTDLLDNIKLKKECLSEAHKEMKRQKDIIIELRKQLAEEKLNKADE